MREFAGSVRRLTLLSLHGLQGEKANGILDSVIGAGSLKLHFPEAQLT